MADQFNGLDNSSILYQNTDDLLSHSILTPFSEQKFDLIGTKADDAPYQYEGYDSLGIYDHYDDSGPSSVHFGDGIESSEPSGNHTGSNNNIVSGDMRANELHDMPGVAGVSLPSSNSHEPTLQHIHINGSRASPSKSNAQEANSPHASKTDTMSISKHHEKPMLDSIVVRGSAITPESSDSPKPVSTRKRKISDITPKKATEEFRAKTSIPEHLTWMEYARQGILAAYSSRLNPYALHPGEYSLLREHITRPQVTIYLNIRNGILRLWHRNPMVGVTRSEAAGCCKDSRYFGLAQVAYDWLMRNGYINFGCVEMQNTAQSIPRQKAKGGRRRTIVVIGAGMSGLGCARHLEGLIAHYGEKFTSNGERPPKIIVLEGRNRLGGRVYSHPFQKQARGTLPAGLRCTVEMGAQIITGFEHGNPMNAIVRGQLGLPYHALRDNSILYDYDGRMVDKRRDIMVERLYNDVLERAAVYRNKLPTVRTVQGDEKLIRFGQDPKEAAEHDSELISSLEDAGVEVTVTDGNPVSTNKSNDNAAAGVVKEGGRSYQLAGSAAHRPAAEAARILGWDLLKDVNPNQTLDLDSVINASHRPTLGETMDEGIRQYQEMLGLTPQDLRLFNWHHANLEYANAANVNQLSLGGWDQDIGNEFEGEHTEIIGGYSQVPRGLYRLPSPLDVRFKHAVKSIKYRTSTSSPSSAAVVVECRNGEKIEADEVVLTVPLGVLKEEAITFSPPLPDWKSDCIKRMGFGLLNKVVLVYESVFWDDDRDMFGLLNTSDDPLNQKSYAKDRGRFYLFWNRTKQSGRPTLVALLAGTSAYSAEETDNESLVREATARLAKIFAPVKVPEPSEAFVTRWKRDEFARGSYSYVGPDTIAGDYDVMAKPVGPIHFAGEATCGTHPATVHGAYISGLRAASDVMTSLLGPINFATPLVPRGPVKVKSEPAANSSPFPGAKKQKGYVDIWEPILPPPDPSAEATLESEVEEYEARLISAIFAELGDRPIKPEKGAANPYLMYQDDEWYNIKSRLEQQTGRKPTRNEVRVVLGAEWRNLPEEKKKPYMERSIIQRNSQMEKMAEYNEKSRTWDQEAARIRREFMLKDPPSQRVKEKLEGRSIIEFGGGGNRIGRKVTDLK
ncbi:uncharacterized protein PV09_04897 [Verruconis gallopava]|uniref:SWIRM domain-containing protein n=1 Tax=Verruconis gallopava TaxID=253628 RepID=A0A0D2AC48_9PEZI|nr:uncharacterized protein PV09_04897 [Verruconis gallopava]KIW04080.1 hypothetical protein PV09_04897 [Verruconis gallopava]